MEAYISWLDASAHNRDALARYTWVRVPELPLIKTDSYKER